MTLSFSCKWRWWTRNVKSSIIILVNYWLLLELYSKLKKEVKYPKIYSFKLLQVRLHFIHRLVVKKVIDGLLLQVHLTSNRLLMVELKSIIKQCSTGRMLSNPRQDSKLLKFSLTPNIAHMSILMIKILHLPLFNKLITTQKLMMLY